MSKRGSTSDDYPVGEYRVIDLGRQFYDAERNQTELVIRVEPVVLGKDPFDLTDSEVKRTTSNDVVYFTTVKTGTDNEYVTTYHVTGTVFGLKAVLIS